MPCCCCFQSVIGLSHRQTIELILSGGTKVKLCATELAKTSIKRGGRKRVLSASKQVSKKLPSRRGRRTATSPNLPSSPGPETGDKQPKHKPFWKRIGRRTSLSLSPGSSLRRTSSLKRMVSSPDGRPARPASPKLSSPSFDFRTLSDQSSSSVSSSPASSPSSPSAHGLGRPGEFEQQSFWFFVKSSSVTSHMGETRHSRFSDAREKLEGKTSRVSFECRECEFPFPRPLVGCEMSFKRNRTFQMHYCLFIFCLFVFFLPSSAKCRTC